jgi:type II secretion system protein I
MNKKAFTLIEVMLSVAILSIGLVLILQAFAQSFNIVRISKDNLIATLIIGNKMAEAQIQAKEDWDAFESGTDERFYFEGIKCEWEMDITPVEWESEEMLDLDKVLNEVKTSLYWKEGRRKGVIFLDTLMRKYAEE